MSNIPLNIDEEVLLWFDASTIEEEDKSYIHKITDLSGNNNHGKTDIGEEPILLKNIINGYSVIDTTTGLKKIKFKRIQFKTLFIVLKETNIEYSTNGPILGDDHFFDFLRHDNNRFLFNNASKLNLNSNSYLNGIKVNPNKLVLPTNNFKLLSILSKVNLISNNIGSDRNLRDGYFKGQIAELIIYKNELTNNKRLIIENYLKNKYLLR